MNKLKRKKEVKLKQQLTNKPKTKSFLGRKNTIETLGLHIIFGYKTDAQSGGFFDKFVHFGSFRLELVFRLKRGRGRDVTEPEAQQDLDEFVVVVDDGHVQQVLVLLAVHA
eukprot:CAMPEP_0174279196 /NCGR_PEP_ID=MMETSP0439-20130205/61902_1 /TAXON_ID=0 /ORGANISM="Stereomyxa ramosa, Strain Chinc5" /LENGTH=110 /DNA_ID=CAMNT_0015371695 /DNA_START=389 /DNA_END=718 /DNA_ORIENTATION=-